MWAKIVWKQTKFGRGTWGERGHCWGRLEWLVARLVRPGLVSTSLTLEELLVLPAVFFPKIGKIL